MNTSKIRAFIAIEFNKALIDRVAEVQRQLKKKDIGKIRWVRPENMHLTLKFLGDIDLGAVDSISQSIEKAVAAEPPISICAQNIGVFPNVKRPKVIWTGIRSRENALVNLHAKLDQKLAELGFEKEVRSFKGHLTLGRFKGAAQTRLLMQTLEDYHQFETEMMNIDQIIFFKSILKPEGPTYIKLAAFKFMIAGGDV